MFKVIPGFSKYKISRDGELISFINNKLISTHRSNGYIFVHIVDDYGNRLSVGIHRLLALAFIPIPDTCEELVINHKDGIKDNNKIENLEWVTRSQNQLHSITLGTSNSAIPVIVTDLRTNKIQHFPSKKSFCSNFNLCYYDISKRLNKRINYFQDFQIEFLVDILEHTRFIKYPNGITIRNIFTGLITVCENIGTTSKVTGIERKVIKRILKGQKFTYPVNGYDIRAGIVHNWPEYTNEELDAFQGLFFIHNPVIVKDSNNSKRLFGSVLKASAFTGTHERTIRECLKMGTRCSGGYSYIKHKRNPVFNM